MKHAFWSVAILFLVTIAGCGGPAAIPVTGQVTFDGDVIENGNIRFCPLEGTPGDGAATKIVDGSYEVLEDQGMLPGNYMILVSATRETGREIARTEVMEGESKTYKAVQQIIPPKYLSRSELRVELIPGPNRHDLKLTSD